MTTQKGAVQGSAAPSRSWATPTVSAAEIIKKVEANDPSLSVIDISNNAVYQMRSDEYTAQLASALKHNTHVRELSLVNCSIGDRGGESLGEALAQNKSIVILNLEKNSLNQDGASAIARGIAHNTTLESINLMNQTHSRWGDKCLDDFLEMFNFNMTLLKINWRLESRKSFALNKMITRNNEIDRRKKNGIAFDDLLPSGLRGTEAETIAKQGRPPGQGKENSLPGGSSPPGDGHAAVGGVPAGHPNHHSANGDVPASAAARRIAPAASGDAPAAAVGELPAKRSSVLSRWPPAAAGNV